jgi:hypothetical protein
MFTDGREDWLPGSGLLRLHGARQAGERGDVWHSASLLETLEHSAGTATRSEAAANNSNSVAGGYENSSSGRWDRIGKAVGFGCAAFGFIFGAGAAIMGYPVSEAIGFPPGVPLGIFLAVAAGLMHLRPFLLFFLPGLVIAAIGLPLALFAVAGSIGGAALGWIVRTAVLGIWSLVLAN